MATEEEFHRTASFMARTTTMDVMARTTLCADVRLVHATDFDGSNTVTVLCYGAPVAYVCEADSNSLEDEPDVWIPYVQHGEHEWDGSIALKVLCWDQFPQSIASWLAEYSEIEEEQMHKLTDLACEGGLTPDVIRAGVEGPNGEDAPINPLREWLHDFLTEVWKLTLEVPEDERL